MTFNWELYMGASLSLLASRNLGICRLELSGDPTFRERTSDGNSLYHFEGWFRLSDDSGILIWPSMAV
jgi:hypothetical protein